MIVRWLPDEALGYPIINDPALKARKSIEHTIVAHLLSHAFGADRHSYGFLGLRPQPPDYHKPLLRRYKWRSAPQEVEGGRYGGATDDLTLFLSMRMPPRTYATGGSRELPCGPQLYRLDAESDQNARGEFSALGYSREPLVASSCERTQRWKENRRDE
jgi:hypothetical protein